MRPLHSGIAPSAPVWRCFWRLLWPRARMAGLGAVLAVAGCTTSARERATPFAAVAQTKHVEAPADGLTRAVAPMPQRPDDAVNPFSPGFGAPAMALPTPLLTSLDADALIARAIVEHEMRRP